MAVSGTDYRAFPLYVDRVYLRYTRIPRDTPAVFYHYTTRQGFEGILRSGGLRASYRLNMNDPSEFQHAQELVDETLADVTKCRNAPRAAHSLSHYARLNIKRCLRESVEVSRAFCACLTLSSDHSGQWERYADKGRGFGLGIDILGFLQSQVPAVRNGHPFIFGNLILYDQKLQRSFVRDLVQVGINDLIRFGEQVSQDSEALTGLRDRILRSIIIQLLSSIDFLKSPEYQSEREFRLFLDPNDGTLKAKNLQYYKRGNDSIPFVFLDMRNPYTKRLMLNDIKIGPKWDFAEELPFVENLLDDLGYGSGGFADRPNITHSGIRYFE